MRTALFAAALATASLTLNIATASATDLVNEDAMAYTVTLTSPDGAHDIEVGAASEVAGVCDGCSIALEGGEPVAAGADDVVVIVDGAISIQE